jgi:hypothetical protein
VFALLVQNSFRNIICLHYTATKLSWPMVEMAICAAFVSISQSLPVFDTMTAHSGVTSGRYKSAFSCEENKTTLGFLKACAIWNAAVFVVTTPDDAWITAASCSPTAPFILALHHPCNLQACASKANPNSCVNVGQHLQVPNVDAEHL